MTILSYNITNGMALSIVSYLILKIAVGIIKDITTPMYVVGVCMLFYIGDSPLTDSFRLGFSRHVKDKIGLISVSISIDYSANRTQQ